MAKGIGYGATLTVDGDAIGGIIDQIENEVSAEEVDTTLLGDLWKSSVPADIDPGELTFDIALDNGDAANTALVDLLTSRATAAFVLTYPNSATTDTFTGWVKSLGRMVAKRQMLTRKVTIKLTGDAGLAGGS